jgi:hypothetical protein
MILLAVGDVCFSDDEIGIASNHTALPHSLPSQNILTYLACLKSLAFEGFQVRQHLIARPLPETSNWIFEQPDFFAWHNTQKGLLQIKGKPGSGKSVMIRHIQSKLTQPSSININYYFNAQGGTFEKSLIGLLRSLVHQLLSQRRDLFTTFLPKYHLKETLPTGWKWQAGELCEYLSDTIMSIQRSSIYIFIDAVDESGSEIRDVMKFLGKLISSTLQNNSRLHICVSSRHYPRVAAKGAFEVSMETWNASDIYIYVQSELFLEDQDTEGVQLQKEIAEKASGVFLWVYLVVDKLLKEGDKGATAKQLRQILTSIPDELHQIYSGLFDKVVEDRQKTVRLMQWVLCAQRPFTPSEIHTAIAFSIESPPGSMKSWQTSDTYLDNDTTIEKVIRTLSKGLIEIKDVALEDNDDGIGNNRTAHTKDSCIVQLIHETVRDFLIGPSGIRILDETLDQLVIERSHDQLARACTHFLSIPELNVSRFPDGHHSHSDWKDGSWSGNESRSNNESNLKYQVLEGVTKYPLLKYAIEWIFVHAEKAEYGGVEQRHLVQYFHCDGQTALDTWRYFQNYWESYWTTYWYRHQYRHEREYRIGNSFFYIASEFGLLSCVSDLLDYDVDVNLEGGPWGYALIAAAGNGHEAVVALLLDKGANIDVYDEWGQSALHIALKAEQEEVVKILLKYHPNPYIPPREQYDDTAINVYYRSDVGRRLEENGIDFKFSRIGSAAPNGTTSTMWSETDKSASILLDEDMTTATCTGKINTL